MIIHSAPDEALSRAPVAIVGGGPVGLMTALFLDRLGVPCVVFDSADGPKSFPKGSTHGARTMEHYRRLGISEQIRALGLPLAHPTDVAYFTRYDAWELARIRMPSTQESMRTVAEAGKTDQVPEPIHRANQMYVERFLLDHIRRRSRITLRFGWHVTDIRQDGAGVTLRAEHDGQHPATTWRTEYLVGCDGGHSFVRRSLGIHYGGEAPLKQAFMGGDMISCHLRSAALGGLLSSQGKAWQYVVVNPQIRMLLVALNGHDEFLLMAKTTDGRTDVDQATMDEILRLAPDTDAGPTVLARQQWTAGVALVAERFAERRIFLAGDAVHLFTPTGGFGMNTGIDDAANLSWKLAAMVQGWGGPQLLDSYEIERRPIAFRNTTAARELAKNVGALPIPETIEAYCAEGEEARRGMGAILSNFNEQFASIGVQLGVRYDGSPIIVPGAAPPTDSFVDYRPTSIPGGRAPHFWINRRRAAGSSIYDKLGIGFTLLQLKSNKERVGALRKLASTRGVPLKIISVKDDQIRDLYQNDLTLIRPDHHVAWSADELPEDIGELIGVATGDCHTTARTWTKAVNA